MLCYYYLLNYATSLENLVVGEEGTGMSKFLCYSREKQDTGMALLLFRSDAYTHGVVSFAYPKLLNSQSIFLTTPAH